jgi:hypothetical protein
MTIRAIVPAPQPARSPSLGVTLIWLMLFDSFLLCALCVWCAFSVWYPWSLKSGCPWAPVAYRYLTN